MTSVHVTSNTEDGQTFVVRIAGHLQDRRSLNAAMAKRLCSQGDSWWKVFAGG